MRRGTTAALSSLLLQSPGTVLLTLFFFLVGLSSGIFLELFMAPTEKLQMADYLTQNLLATDFSDTSFPLVLLQSLGNNMGLLAVIALAGISVVGFPAAFLAVAYKGMALGFSASLLIETMAGKGMTVILLSMVPQNLILIPALLAAAIAAVNLSGRVFAERRQKGIKKSLSQSAGPYLTIFVLLAFAVLSACFVEAFIAPVLLQLIG